MHRRIQHRFALACFIICNIPGSSFAGELDDLRASLQEMQNLLHQQQRRIEQLEKQAAQGSIAAPRLAGPVPLPTEGAPASTTSTAPPPVTAFPGAGQPTFYGRLDLFAEADWGGTRGNRLGIESGGMNGSRVGLKGSPNITPETSFIYQIEAGFFANNGRLGQTDSSTTRIFGRQVYAGIDGRLGKLTVGRQYSPFFNEMVHFDAFDNGYGSPTNDGNVKPGPYRYDNALIYSTPGNRAVIGSGFVALGGQTGGTARNTLGLSVDYSQGPLGLGLAYQHDNHNAVLDRSTSHAFAGGAYQFGRTRLMGGLAWVNTSPDLGLETSWRSWFIGTRSDLTTSGQLRLNYGDGHTHAASLGDRGRVFSAAWMETISQQFRAYLAWSRHINQPGSALAASGTSASGYYVINPGDNASGLALGLQYTF